MIRNYEKRKREPLSDIETLFLELVNIRRHRHQGVISSRILNKQFLRRVEIFNAYGRGLTLENAGKRMSRERVRQIVLRFERDIQNYILGAGRIGISLNAKKMHRYLSEIEQACL